MRYYVKTYHQHITKIILISFLFVTILSVFHYHNYELLGEISVNRQNQTENSSQLIKDDLQIVCTIDIQELNYYSPEIFYLLSANKLPQNLRAPPSL
jgi:hypothetical protein